MRKKKVYKEVMTFVISTAIKRMPVYNIINRIHNFL